MKEYKVKLGKTYTLGFGTKALRIYEREVGRPVNELSEYFGVDTVAALLHAGMAYHHPEVSAEDVEALIDTFLEKDGDIEPIASTLSSAVLASGWFSSPTKAAATTKDSGETPAE